VSALCALCRYRHKSHEDLHWGDNRAEAKTKTRSQRELEAEATTYVVMRHFGIEHVASNYLATYKVDGEQLRASLETISGAAKRLIAAIQGDKTNTEATETIASSELEEELMPA
jgi:hypothetical protein